MNITHRLAGAAVALALTLGAGLPALARDSYVNDGAALFSESTVSALNAKISAFNQRTGKEIVIVTVPSLDGKSIADAAESTFAAQQVNGVLFFLSKADQKDRVVGDRASRAFFPAGSFSNIASAMRGDFRNGDFDSGIMTGVNLVLDQYNSHASSLGGQAPVRRAQYAPSTSLQSTGGSHMSFLWLIGMLLIGFLIIRAIFRAMVGGPRMMPPGYGGGGGYGPGGPGYGPGYGGGYGGGGGFFSGLLGGLGGAFLGNELFGNRGTTFVQGPVDTSSAGGLTGGGDSSGWQSDAGQADMGNAGGGSWGGGGFDAGGGGGFDSGGGGGFDSGGGGGDSGGGW